MLTPQEAFKVGFLARCVSDGLSPDQILTRVKQAHDLLEKKAILGNVINGVSGAAGSVAKGLAGYGIPLALLAPPALGGLAGYGLAKATDVDDTDVAEIKQRELVDEYQRQVEAMKRQKDVRKYKEHRQHTGRMFM